jgi:hypothetical protein
MLFPGCQQAGCTAVGAMRIVQSAGRGNGVPRVLQNPAPSASHCALQTADYARRASTFAARESLEFALS